MFHGNNLHHVWELDTISLTQWNVSVRVCVCNDLYWFICISVRYSISSKIYVHIWKSLNSCTPSTVNSELKQESRLSSLSALKTANISLSIYICVWDLASVRAPTPWVTAELHGECVSCTPPLLTDGSHWQSRWRLRPRDPQPRLMTQAADRSGRGLSGEAAGQLVCMSIFMEYAFMLAHKSWARSPSIYTHSLHL